VTELLALLDELDRLVRTATRTGMQSKELIAGLWDGVEKVQVLLAGTTKHDFFDAGFELSEAIRAYEENPTPLGLSKIGNELVRYRRTATS
jgi:hypothetical protein